MLPIVLFIISFILESLLGAYYFHGVWVGKWSKHETP